MYNPRKLLRCLTQFRNGRNTARSRIGNSHFQTFCLCLSHPASKEESVFIDLADGAVNIARCIYAFAIVQRSTNWDGWICLTGIKTTRYIYLIFYIKLRDLESNCSLFLPRIAFSSRAFLRTQSSRLLSHPKVFAYVSSSRKQSTGFKSKSLVRRYYIRVKFQFNPDQSSPVA